MRLTEFVSANPYMAQGEWRRELVAGHERTLARPDPDTTYRIMMVAQAVVSTVRRSKLDARIEMGGGIGIAAEAGDEFRVAGLVAALAGKSGRHDPVLVCVATPDPEHPTEDESERIGIFRRCPTVREVLEFAVGRPCCRVHRRSGSDWTEETVEGTEATIRLAPFKASIFMSVAYSDLAPPAVD